MANGNTGAAQNKLGELFVELGTKGSGNLLGTLNKVSAQFLLTKNAAEQFIKPIINTADKAGKSAIEIRKLSTVLGATDRQIQSMKFWLEKKGLSDAILGDFEKLSSVIYNFQRGLRTPDMFPFQELGIQLGDYESNLKGVLKLTEDIRQALAGRPAEEQRMLLGRLGYSNVEDLMYMFRNMPASFTNLPNMLSSNEVDALIRSEEAMNEVRQNVQKAFEMSIAQLSDVIVKLSEVLSDFIKKMPGGVKKVVETTGNIQKNIKKEEERRKNTTLDPFMFTPTWYKGLLDTASEGAYNFIKKKAKRALGYAANISDISPEFLNTNGIIPNNTNQITQPAQINITQNIQSTDPTMAGQESADKIAEAMNNSYQIRYSGMG